ncbi:hypothetical protein ACFWDG_19150, partial [Peribacillus sp. NPDC060186]
INLIHIKFGRIRKTKRNTANTQMEVLAVFLFSIIKLFILEETSIIVYINLFIVIKHAISPSLAPDLRLILNEE